MDYLVFHSWQSAKNTKSSYEEVKLKDFKIEESKARSQLSIFTQLDNDYIKARKKWKKDYCNRN